MPQSDQQRVIGDSPLLNASSPEIGGDHPDHSVHPDRLEMSRFSDMQEDEEPRNYMRIIIYVVGVVAIGAAAALGVRYFLLSDSTEEDETEEVADEEDNDPAVDTNPLQVRNTVLTDDQATSVSEKDDFKTAELLTFGDSDVAVADVEFAGLLVQPYESFTRVTMTVNGADTVPASELTFDESENILVVDFPDAMAVVDGLAFSEAETIGGLIESVVYDSTDATYTFQLSESSLYNLQVDDRRIFLDVVTEEEFETYNVTEQSTGQTTQPSTDEDEEPADDSTNNSNQQQQDTTQETQAQRPEGTNYENNFSTNRQFVTNVLEGNTINYNETFYEDAVDYFEIAWGSRNNVGVDYIPNASAELMTDEAGPYIQVVIENLATIPPQQTLDESNISISLASANFTSLELQSFEKGTATYRVNLKTEAEFKLFTTTTVSGATQVLALQIRDN